jgi:hypothetical protein
MLVSAIPQNLSDQLCARPVNRVRREHPELIKSYCTGISGMAGTDLCADALIRQDESLCVCTVEDQMARQVLGAETEVLI